MIRLILVPATCSILLTVAVSAQQQPASSAYQGVSNPPSDAAITVSVTEPAQPSAAVAAVAVQAPVEAAVPTQPAAPAPDPAAAQPVLITRAPAPDPDGDIVHPEPLGSGQLEDGTRIRVKLLNRLSTLSTEKGEHFHGEVASDVIENGQVLIPAGAEIDGTVVEASSGHFGGHGSMHLRPERVILLNGSSFELRALVTALPGLHTRVGEEGVILPASRVRRDEIEYGGAVGVGVTTGAILGGAPGALAGGLIGVGVVTAHLMTDHPEATLEPGTMLELTLTDRVSLVAAAAGGTTSAGN